MYSHSKKVFAAICAVMLLLAAFGSVSSAAAETAKYKTTQKFMDYLDKKDIKYKYLGMSDDKEVVSVSYNLDYYSSLTCKLYFDSDCDLVSLRVWHIATASAGKNYVCSTLNSLNKAYKFVKFVFDESDSSINGELDLYVDADYCAVPIYSAMRSMFNVIDYEAVAEKIHSLE